MTGTEALQSVQFVTVGGRRLAVVDAGDWDALIEWLEGVEDLEIARAALSELKAADGDRDQAGWQKWDEAGRHLG
jgi:hypothetical protein